jgi:2-succinyl-5-enolpyruvyl-6-hydroxy-3-cyclohexene-1-carboxylate synthase
LENRKNMVSKASDKPAIARLVAICHSHGLKRVLVSPGSRNAPLSLSFTEHGGFDVKVIPDERAAGFMALGMSQVDHVPTILLCTSGSAVLNYAPAVAEAFYQRIPLLVISADRPNEWVDQLEGQTMMQKGVLSNFVNKEFDLPQEPKDDVTLRYHDRLVNEAIAACFYPVLAPVHLNVHLREPLYGLSEMKEMPYVIQVHESPAALPCEKLIKELSEELNSYSKVMLLMGLHSPDEALKKVLEGLIEKGWVLLNESSSNLQGEKVISCIDRSLGALPAEAEMDFQPELIISFAGPLVSKKIKQRFRKNPPKAHWHIDAHQAHIDMFQCQTRALRFEPFEILKALNKVMVRGDGNFSAAWMNLKQKSAQRHERFVELCPWSDMRAYSEIFKNLKGEYKVQMANSAAVRYAQLYEHEHLEFYGNRGVSGIDGCSSTAVGMAHESDSPVVLLTGDMAFRYDVNAFWTKEIPSGLKCIVVNNGGGGIFRIIPGPKESGHLEDLFEAAMENSAKRVAEISGMPYLSAKNAEELNTALNTLFSDDKSMILEVFTPREENEKVLAKYFEALKK